MLTVAIKHTAGCRYAECRGAHKISYDHDKLRHDLKENMQAVFFMLAIIPGPEL